MRGKTHGNTWNGLGLFKTELDVGVRCWLITRPSSRPQDCDGVATGHFLAHHHQPTYSSTTAATCQAMHALRLLPALAAPKSYVTVAVA